LGGDLLGALAGDFGLVEDAVGDVDALEGAEGEVVAAEEVGVGVVVVVVVTLGDGERGHAAASEVGFLAEVLGVVSLEDW